MKLLTLDCEATGVNPREDRIVQFFAGVLDEDYWVDSIEMIVNPGVPIPQESIDVHGITQERVSAEGVTTRNAMHRIREFLYVYRDLPFVIMNARYDVPLINTELRRQAMRPLPVDRIHFIDPLVIDRGMDRYRKGSRKLANLAEHYGVDVDPTKLHDAAEDCRVAGLVAQRQIEQYGMPSNAVQAKWHRGWAEHFQQYLRDQGDPDASIGREWPE